MWDGLLMLLTLGAIMAFASFLAGSLPLFFAMSPRRMRVISSIGTGLLVGTALIVIIPEGIETLYSAEASIHPVSLQSTVQSSLDLPAKGAAAALKLHGSGNAANAIVGEELGKAQGDRDFEQYNAKGKSPNAPGPPDIRVRSTPGDIPIVLVERRDHTTDKAQTSSHAWIGITLITGFIMMYLIDVLPSISSSPSSSEDKVRGAHVPLHDLDADQNGHLNHPPATPTSRNTPASHTRSTTIGLIIHSFADGIALGASTASPSTQSTLGLVVFIAILVHKAPAAFGLTSVLLKQGLSRRAARTHLVLFSFAAPLGALITWAFVNAAGVTGEGSAGKWGTGIALIFSGGTFLYVAMHAMQAVSAPSVPPTSNGHYSAADDGEFGGSSPYTPPTSQKSGKMEVALMVVGMLLPLLTQVGHAHSHG
ncbi:Zinc/iron permease [Tothia fuscella]|uniref:Zinc/iron permease n=1 Tax=Tothia fuscella TaxID=1048955 RepID=A0A9P4TUZ7_9PEZI|nr:Zinc/iron permease [Tothia fuscella]